MSDQYEVECKKKALEKWNDEVKLLEHALNKSTDPCGYCEFYRDDEMCSMNCRLCPLLEWGQCMANGEWEEVARMEYGDTTLAKFVEATKASLKYAKELRDAIRSDINSLTEEDCI